MDEKGRKFTWISTKLNNVGEGAVVLVIAVLDLNEIRRIWRETFNCNRHLINDHTFNHPVTIAVRTIFRVKDDVTQLTIDSGFKN